MIEDINSPFRYSSDLKFTLFLMVKKIFTYFLRKLFSSKIIFKFFSSKIDYITLDTDPFSAKNLGSGSTFLVFLSTALVAGLTERVRPRLPGS